MSAQLKPTPIATPRTEQRRSETSVSLVVSKVHSSDVSSKSHQSLGDKGLVESCVFQVGFVLRHISIERTNHSWPYLTEDVAEMMMCPAR